MGSYPHLHPQLGAEDSCTPTTTCEAHAAINKSEHRHAVHHFAHTPQESVLRGDCEENPKCGLTRRLHPHRGYDTADTRVRFSPCYCYNPAICFDFPEAAAVACRYIRPSSSEAALLSEVVSNNARPANFTFSMRNRPMES
ncbi:hypothetical protein EVAR_7121_1 [Eumeta japonica]|uniref:Uncharacterized protein n=1 Tax=Eumeta variegata TaxID=151549 RepID=A0A4C1U6J4_EUMVA|nr:hypothetical protein EVAR_7121_1 [Eumeta japonica]